MNAVVNKHVTQQGGINLPEGSMRAGGSQVPGGMLLYSGSSRLMRRGELGTLTLAL